LIPDLAYLCGTQLLTESDSDNYSGNQILFGYWIALVGNKWRTAPDHTLEQPVRYLFLANASKQKRRQ